MYLGSLMCISLGVILTIGPIDEITSGLGINLECLTVLPMHVFDLPDIKPLAYHVMIE